MAKNVYAIVEGAPIPVVSGQAKIVLDCIREIGKPFAIEQLVPMAKTKNLNTVQTPTRICGYYTCLFHKNGYLQVVGKMNDENKSIVPVENGTKIVEPAKVPVSSSIILTDSWRD